MLSIEINNITKSFSTKNKTTLLLNDCSLSVKSDEIFGLIGLNGIGKTTIIKSILNITNIDSGSINIFDMTNQNQNSRSKLCYLPEKFQPLPYLTGYDFLSISLSFFNKKLDKDKAIEMAKKIDLNPDALDVVIKKYSKGMGQKLGLAFCLLSDAKLLILDEPMSGLDPKSRIMLKKALLEYKDKGNSVFFSSHILEDINEICDNLAILNNKKIIFTGKSEELKHKYNAKNLEEAFLKCIDFKF